MTRLDIEVPAEVMIEGKESHLGVTHNISFSSMRIRFAQEMASSEVGKSCHVRLQLPSDQGAAWLALEARVIRSDDEGVAVQLVGADTESFRQLKTLLSSHVDNPMALIQEITRNPDMAMSVVHTGFMKEELNDYITDSVNDIFLAFLSEGVSTGPSVITNALESYDLPDAEATAVVNFNGAFNGGVHFSAPLYVALNFATTFAGEPVEKINDPIAVDAFGELANMIAGGVQTRLSVEFENINLTPPTVVFGQNYGIIYQSNLHSVKQYFKADIGPFFVECFFGSS
uniref:Chemotaxis phosphatase CheX-like domain-containing protein n=1 Tax=Magnetococcus massalia (strain MO-1) TaxID=451514 RepID=A0A1S7LJ07_MAGMO|nr:Putative protein with type IV pilus assembly PilZ domain and CheC-like family domain [Candidatus Magnetococcus massalia]